MKKTLENYFEFKRHNAKWNTEIYAGISTYISLAYIFIVNPAILSTTGMNTSAIFFATVVSSGLTTLIMGAWARLPFAVAPGLEMNSFFSFVVVAGFGLSWRYALLAVLISGILFLITTMRVNYRKMSQAVPEGLKKGIGYSVCIFVLLTGLYLAGFADYRNGYIRANSFASIPAVNIISLLIGLCVSAILMFPKLKFSAGILIAIIIAAIYLKTNGVAQKTPVEFSNEMFSGFIHVDKYSASIKLFVAVLILFFINLYGSISKYSWLTSAVSSFYDNDNQVIRADKGLKTDAAGTVFGGLIGTSNLITYVESGVGISLGGRTGITAIICGLLMLTSFFFVPIVGLIPVEATSGAIVYVGGTLFIRSIKHNKPQLFDILIYVLMISVIAITFNLGYTLAIGFFAYSVRHLIDSVKNKTKPNFYLIIPATLIFTVMVLAIFFGQL